MKKIILLLTICLITLTACHKEKEIESVTFSKIKSEYLISEKETISYEVLPSDVLINECKWESSDESVCIVTNGELTFLKEGKCVIKLVLNGKNYEFNIQVIGEKDMDIEEPVVKKIEEEKEEEPKVDEYPIEKENSNIEVIDGITYVDGILIANKTYSLPASYDPEGIIDYVLEAFNTMQDAASKEGIDIYIVSGYRSYEYQKGLYQRYCDRDGQAKADTYSARAGHSEHQTGLAMDINDVSYAFGETKAGKWVSEHGHEYGFIIRYPKDKEDITGYNYEPWHIRYLGVEVATKVKESGLCLEEYLGITSAYQD